MSQLRFLLVCVDYPLSRASGKSVLQCTIYPMFSNSWRDFSSPAGLHLFRLGAVKTWNLLPLTSSLWKNIEKWREFTQQVQHTDHNLYTSLCIQMCSWLTLSSRTCWPHTTGRVRCWKPAAVCCWARTWAMGWVHRDGYGWGAFCSCSNCSLSCLELLSESIQLKGIRFPKP